MTPQKFGIVSVCYGAEWNIGRTADVPIISSASMPIVWAAWQNPAKYKKLRLDISSIKWHNVSIFG